MNETFPIAVLISGGGTTLKNLIQKRDDGRLMVEFKLVISSSSEARGIEIARQANIPTLVVPKDKGLTPEDYSERMFGPIRRSGAELVVMGGFLKHVLIPSDFENRVINIHPSLIPAFCGKGMYGLKVHQAAVDFGVRISGCTVHYVDNQYDHGPILMQRSCQVFADDTAESLQRRVFELECLTLPDAIRQIAQDYFSKPIP
jgi:phosphoribosylglycinamide formyltransferase 1